MLAQFPVASYVPFVFIDGGYTKAGFAHSWTGLRRRCDAPEDGASGAEMAEAIAYYRQRRMSFHI
jgi:hypothetical protein